MIGTLIGAMAAAAVVNNADDIGRGIGKAIDGAMSKSKKSKAVKQNPELYATVTTEPDMFYGENYADVIKSFVGMGFNNVALKEDYEPIGRFIKTDRTGWVTSITINGSEEIEKNAVFEKSAYVVVTATVHDKTKHLPFPQIYRPQTQQQTFANTQNQQYNMQGQMQGGQMGMQYQQYQQYQQRPVQPVPEKRCAYCNVLVSQGQKFCNRCGAPL